MSAHMPAYISAHTHILRSVPIRMSPYAKVPTKLQNICDNYSQTLWSMRTSMHMPMHMYICMSVYLSMHTPTHMSIHMSTHMSKRKGANTDYTREDSRRIFANLHRKESAQLGRTHAVGDDFYAHVYTHVYTHVCAQVDGHAYTHVHIQIYTHSCLFTIHVPTRATIGGEEAMLGGTRVSR